LHSLFMTIPILYVVVSMVMEEKLLVEILSYADIFESVFYESL